MVAICHRTLYRPAVCNKQRNGSIKIIDTPESSGNVLKQRMVVNIPQASEDIFFDLIGNAIVNTGTLWQYGLTYDGRVFRFYFNCTAELAVAERDDSGFFLTNTSVIEIGEPGGIPFLVCIILFACYAEVL